MTKTVKDAALLLEVIAGSDGDDFRQPTCVETQKYTSYLTGCIKDMKIGFVKEGFEICEENVSGVVKATRHIFEEMLAVVEWISIPEHKQALSYFYPVILAGIKMHVIDAEGTAVGHKGFYPTSMCEYLRRGYKASGNKICHPRIYMLFADYIKTNYGNKFYNKSRNICKDITKKIDAYLDRYDVLVMPTMPSPAKKVPQVNMTLKDDMALSGSDINNTAPYNYTGHPAITINAGFLDGLPVGVMIVGKHFDDGTVLKVAHALEKALKEKE